MSRGNHQVTQSLRHLWQRPCGGLDVCRIAIPLVISTASWTVMHFIDRMFLYWDSVECMAAAMPAGLISFTLMCFPLGLATYANTFVAQYYGATRLDRVGLAVFQGVIVGAISVPLFLLTIPLAPYFFEFVGHEPAIRDLETVYYQYLMLGAGGGIMAAAMASFFTGTGNTKVVMYINAISALLNVVLDYLWIFGHLGFPAMGIAGAALATAVSQWLKVAAYWILMNRSEYRERFGIRAGRRVDSALLTRLLRYGGPNGVQMFLETAAFTILLLIVGRLGEEALAATTLAFNVNSIAFVPMLGLGVAVSTLVGQQLGNNQPGLAARATWTSFSMGLVYVGIMGSLYLIVPDLFLFGHSMGVDEDEFQRLRSIVVVLLRFVAAYCVLDMMQIVFASAIKGAGDTRFVLLVTVIVSPIPLVLGWLGLNRWGWSLYSFWFVITAWITALGVIYAIRFSQGKWREMRVIESPEVAVLSTEDLPVAADLSSQSS